MSWYKSQECFLKIICGLSLFDGANDVIFIEPLFRGYQIEGFKSGSIIEAVRGGKREEVDLLNRCLLVDRVVVADDTIAIQ